MVRCSSPTQWDKSAAATLMSTLRWGRGLTQSERSITIGQPSPFWSARV